MTYKKSIDDVAEVLCDKLEALNVGAVEVSALKVLAIQVEVSLLLFFISLVLVCTGTAIISPCTVHADSVCCLAKLRPLPGLHAKDDGGAFEEDAAVGV